MKKSPILLCIAPGSGMGSARMLRASHSKYVMLWLIALLVIVSSALHAQGKTDSTPHRVQFVTVEKDVKLEVLDWGGTGRPLVFLAGLGNTAHIFDKFAPKFTAHYHVYGITRRGFGTSSKPPPTVVNYAADRLGDDVLAVIAALKLNRPVLVGHSIAGEELSSIGSRHSEKVAGLIYLDAAYPYAYYNRANGDWVLDMLDLKQRMDALQSGATLDHQFLQGLSTSVSQFEEDLQAKTKQMASMPDLPSSPPPPPGLAIMFGARKYTEIHGPILAIFACPHSFDFVRNGPTAKVAMVADDFARCSAQVNAFQAGVPSAHVVRLPNTDHYVFNANEADVSREMNAFLPKLP
jgi:non-heme chloroperoxidase